MALTIKPICLGVVRTTDKSVFTYLKDQGTKVVTPFFMWAIEGEKETVIVDSGPSDPEVVLREPGRVLERTSEQEPVRALGNQGIDPAKIRVVVATHLHWDHSANFHLFPKAEIYVQRAEMEFAVAPPPIFGEVYEAAIFGKFPKWSSSISRFKIVEGDLQLLPGIHLVHLPGHTPGLQGVVVETEDGAYCIASDTINLYENWNYRIPPGIHVNIEDCYRSFKKIEGVSDHVLPGHDLEVLQKSLYP